MFKFSPSLYEKGSDALGAGWESVNDGRVLWRKPMFHHTLVVYQTFFDDQALINVVVSPQTGYLSAQGLARLIPPLHQAEQRLRDAGFQEFVL